MNIALTGGRGFIGRTIARKLLEDGHHVRILTRNSKDSVMGCDSVVGNLLEPQASQFRELLTGADCLIHLAGEINDVSVMRQLHVNGTAALIDAVPDSGMQWIQISSCGVYGNKVPSIVDETTSCEPVGTYETTKFEAERLVASAAEKGLFTATILRPSVVYGAQMPNNSLRALIDSVRRKRFFFIGAPGALYNHVHVDDLADAVLNAMKCKTGKNEIFNVSTALTMEALIGRIAQALNLPVPRVRVNENVARALAAVFAPVPKFPLTQSRVSAMTCRTRYSAEAFFAATGWSARVDIADIIPQLAITEVTDA